MLAFWGSSEEYVFSRLLNGEGEGKSYGWEMGRITSLIRFMKHRDARLRFSAVNRAKPEVPRAKPQASLTALPRDHWQSEVQ